MTDIIKQADGFRLSVNPTPEDVDKANWLIDRLSSRVAGLEGVLSLWLKYDQCDNVNSVDMMLDYNAALEATQAAMKDTAR